MSRTALVQKCYQAKPGDVTKKWYVIDAKDQVLGRLAVKVATMLMGKDKPTFTPHVDTGAFIVVINAEKIRVTGKKSEQKTYETYSRYPGGHKVIPYDEMQVKHPDKIIELAVWGMLPKTKLGKHLMKNLKIYAGTEHPHVAQNPEALAV
jgi:large subunit ribosomal protein L13